MRIVTILAFVAVLTIGGIAAFAETHDVSLDDLRTPTSPAFILMDVSPTLIAYPTSPKEFAISVLSAPKDDNGLPKNYAMEFGPFWLFKNKGYTALRFWGIKDINDANPSELWYDWLWKSLSVSFAYINDDSTSTSSGATSVLGARACVIKVMGKKYLKEMRKAAETLATRVFDINTIKNDLDTRIAPNVYDSADPRYIAANTIYAAMLDAVGKGDKEVEAAAHTAIEALKVAYASDEALVKDLIAYDAILAIKVLNGIPDTQIAEAKIQEMLGKKPIFELDLAAAAAANFQDKDFEKIKLGRVGAWTTICLNIAGREATSPFSMDFLGLGRYFYDSAVTGGLGQENILDYGGKLALDIDRLSISIEGLGRQPSGGDFAYRYSAELKYRVSDSGSISYSIGKDFSTTNNLIAKFSVGLNLGSTSLPVN